MIHLEFSGWVVGLFAVAAAVLAVASGFTASSFSEKRGDSLGLLTGAVTAIPWFLLLTWAFSSSGPVPLGSTPDVVAWVFGLASFILALVCALAAAAFWNTDDEDPRVFGVFAASAVPWFTVLVLLFGRA